jgi:NADH:ubiquinone reductase (H+-translocating)
MKRLVILGGGYGGLTIAHQLLEKDIPSDTVITMIDRMPFQGLKTEYYALVSGTVSEKEVRVGYPIHPHLIMHYGEVDRISLDDKLIYLLGQDPIPYDMLVIGLGCVDKYHDIPGAEAYTCSVQTLSATRRTYQRVQDVRPYGQVSVVGGGLSGVEIAAELRESRPDLKIRILDRGPSILSAFPEKLQSFVREWFHEHDVEMLSHICLSRVEEGVVYDGNAPFFSDVTVWTAGIQPSPVVQALPVEKDAMGRVKLDSYHRIPTHPEVFVVGDCASLPFSPSAQAAEGQGKQIAQIVRALWKNETPNLGLIKLKGVLGSLGKKSGFGVMGNRTVMVGKVPRALKSGVLWKSKRHFG